MAGKSRLDTGQQALFEEDYLLRTLGDLGRLPDLALTELVANAWDAGASEVALTIPAQRGERLVVQDDGCGLSPDLFKTRWMTLGYNRTKHQGSEAEFPPGRAHSRRRAYGRNGLGRHGLLCFGDEYEVDTTRDSVRSHFAVEATSGPQPFRVARFRSEVGSAPGTRLSVVVHRHLPKADEIRDVIATRFLHDPGFRVVVNGLGTVLEDLKGCVGSERLTLEDGSKLDITWIEGDAGRAKHQSGVAFWVGGRLVGTPGWTVGDEVLVDGRRRIGRRLTFIVRTHDLYDDVLPDWTGFKATERAGEALAAVADHVRRALRGVMASHIRETTEEVIKEFREPLSSLEPSARYEVAKMAEAIVTGSPLTSPDQLAAAVQGMIAVKSSSGKRLLIEKIMRLSPEDVDGLNRLLDEWTVQDALVVLDEIGRRIRVVELIEGLMSDPGADELKVLHPLVTEARWLFGPEFESASYASNLSIRRAVEKVFGVQASASDFTNPRKRPDLVFLARSTVSVVGVDEPDVETNLMTLRRVLVIELKKGASTIGRDEMNQADGYVQDLLGSGLLDGRPQIDAFVVGHEVDSRTARRKTVGDADEGRIRACSYGQLVRTANARLFDLRSRVEERCGEELSQSIGLRVEAPKQAALFDGMASGLRPASVSPSSAAPT